jgi:hypothetical protein
MGKGAKVPAANPLPAAPDPNADSAAKDAAGAAKTNEGRRLRSLASGSEGDSSMAPTSAPGLKTTLGGGSGAV